MTDIRSDSAARAGDEIEALLSKATPRPSPPAADAAAVKAAIHIEWRTMTGRRRTRRSLLAAAVAASILVAVFASLNLLRVNGIEAEQVASIGKRYGSIFVLGDNAELSASDDLAGITTGQTLVTDQGSGVGLEWHTGGSLRLDAETRVEFVAADLLYLHSGRVYFDSAAQPGSGRWAGDSSSGVRILTSHGEVSHVGTQYMVEVDSRRMVVSVREGEVDLSEDNGARVQRVASGQQLELGRGGSAGLVNISAWGDNWAWVEKTSPAFDLDGRSVAELLSWVSRETGLALAYEDDRSHDVARQERLNGTLDVEPRRALDIWMLGTRLSWRIDNGVIHVALQEE